MKKIATLIISLATATLGFAQETTPVMHVNLKAGATVDYPLTEIETITFEEVVEAPLPVAVALSADFSSSYVQKVLAGGKQVAELAQEYVAGLGKVVVVYPCDENGKADLTKGLAANGATVAWQDGKPVVGEASGDYTTLYIVDGAVVTDYADETQAAVLSPEMLVDTRGTETISYPLVKIGQQYWTAVNLRATKWNDGTAIDAYSETQGTEWNANTTGAYLIDNETDWVNMAGLLYSGYCAISDKIAPQGWRVPTCADYASVRIAVNARTAALYKDASPLAWSDGKQGNNDTNFSAVGTGYFSSATNLTALYTDTYIWTSDHAYDALARAEAADFFRVTATGANAVFPTKGLNPHSLNFGHAIRLVRE